MAGAASTAAGRPTFRFTTFSHEADWETTPSKTSSPSVPSVIEGCIRPSKKVSSEILSVAGKLDILFASSDEATALIGESDSRKAFAAHLP